MKIEETITKKYVQDGMTVKQIAKETNLSIWKIRAILIEKKVYRFGIMKRKEDNYVIRNSKD